MATVQFITLYNVDKRRNSTKQPTAAEKVCDITGNFNEASSMFTPTILLNRNMSTQNAVNFNYMSISWPESITRYYWVTDKVIMPDGRISVSAVEDLLATFKDNLLNSVNYIERLSKVPSSINQPSNNEIANIGASSVNGLYNSNLVVDTGINVGASLEYVDALENVFSETEGFYVVGFTAREVNFDTFYDEDAQGNITRNTTKVADYGTAEYITQNGDTSQFKTGGVSYYTFSAYEFRTFINSVKTAQGVFADLNVMQYISNILYCPVNLYSIMSTEELIENQVNTVWDLGVSASDALAVDTGSAFLNGLVDIYNPDKLTQYHVLFPWAGRTAVPCPNGSIMLKKSLPLNIQPLYWVNFMGCSYMMEPYTNVSFMYGPFGQIDLSLKSMFAMDELTRPLGTGYVYNYGTSSPGIYANPYLYQYLFQLLLEVDLFTGAASLSVVRSRFSIGADSNDRDITIVDGFDSNGNYTGKLITKEHAVICPSVPVVSITSDSRIREIANERNLKFAKVAARTAAVGSTVAGLAGAFGAPTNSVGSSQFNPLTAMYDYSAERGLQERNIITTSGAGTSMGKGLAGVVATALSEYKARSDYEIASWENALPTVRIAGSSGTFLDIKYAEGWTCSIKTTIFLPQSLLSGALSSYVAGTPFKVFFGYGPDYKEDYWSVVTREYIEEGVPYHSYELLYNAVADLLPSDYTHHAIFKKFGGPYVKTRNAILQVTSNMTLDEQAAVCTLMDSGIFVE